MRRAARVDVNQPAIVKALRGVGASVQPLHMVGKGCPDLLVAFRGDTFVFEVKDGAKPPSQRRLTPDEAQWHTGWQAPVYVVESVEDALRVIGATE